MLDPALSRCSLVALEVGGVKSFCGIGIGWLGTGSLGNGLGMGLRVVSFFLGVAPRLRRLSEA